MAGYHGLELLMGVAMLLTVSQCNLSCQGTDGHSGEAGIPGRAGWRGAKGEKGEPALMVSGPVVPDVLLRLKGDTGSRGKQGAMGPKGYRGEVGPAGSPGHRGPDGKSIGNGEHAPHQARSAFSVLRTDHSYPPFGQVVTYQDTVVNTHGDFTAATGHFTCRLPGVYYFTFQSVARASVCLRISRDPPFNKLGFCDYNRSTNTEQVLSGGVVLQLTAGQRVWLESFKDRQSAVDAQNTQEKQIFFSGFLLFSNSI